MIVSYARCITIATGAMLAIGAYGAALPVVRFDVPFLAALLFATRVRAPSPDLSSQCRAYGSEATTSQW